MTGPDSNHRQFERYVNGGPSAVYEVNAVMVFLNLVPDFRPPDTPVQGKWLALRVRSHKHT